MPGLLDKLNTLVKASLNNIVSDSPTLPGSSRARVPAARLGKDIDKEIAALRQHIDDALSQEDAMKDRLSQMQQQIDSTDQQADAALQNGDEPTARYLIQQMKRQQQLATMLTAELREHRQATSELIERVNTLDSMVSDARREAANQPPEPSDLGEPTPTDSLGSLSSILKEARTRLEDTLTARNEPAHHVPITIQDSGQDDTDAAKPPAESAPQPSAAVPTSPPPSAPVGIKVSVTPDPDKPPAAPIPTSPPADRDDTDDDIARRRARLSKPE